MISTRVADSIDLHDFGNFDCRTLMIESSALKGNALGDPYHRRHPVLVPRKQRPKEGWPVVLVLSGFTGNGPASFNIKGLEPNLPQILDACLGREEAPNALFVFCDAWTRWGGSQFVNSAGTGQYSDHIAYEVYDAIRANFDVNPAAEKWCLSGGSSGGYGALHLGSLYPEKFGLVAAIAPDSFFEASLLPEIRAALPVIQKLGGLSGVDEEMARGRFMKRRDSHTILNSIAMGLCYAPGDKGEVEWPIDPSSGKVIDEIWKRWLSHDPIHFLRDRRERLSLTKKAYLDVGIFDQFHLQYGTRQVRSILGSFGVAVDSSEFEGNHFDISERRPLLWRWLADQWQ